ncbi:hypothetical protein [Streptomyces sp. 3211]|uniref:hypothetical protein n=1 Tax=Streptomyces sp. 3211 TaxID=1964449 RepID=UPI0009A4C4AA|nr:hypothetical protein [Streptomyces sp. 3211]
MTVVRDAAVPLPDPLIALLTDLKESLETTAVKDPLVALKALADLRYLVAGVGADAALAVQVGRIPMETVATALGTSEAAARMYVNGYRHP